MGTISLGTDEWRKVANSYFTVLGVEPNEVQASPFFHPARIKLVMGGERSGKSFAGALYLTVQHFLAGEGALFWLVGADYELCRPEFGYIVNNLAKLYGPDALEVSFPKEGSCAVVIKDTKTRIETRTAENPTKIAGRAPDGILGCEVALWDYETFLRVRGRLAERRAWLWASGSFESSLGWLPDLFKRWSGPNTDNAASFTVPSWTNSALYPLGFDDPEFQALGALYPADRFTERFAGIPVPPAGIVYKEFSVIDHVTADADYKPDVPVALAIDPGYAGAYAVLFLQVVDGVVRVFDEIYAQRLVHDEVIHLAITRPCWRDVGEGVIDMAGRQHPSSESAVEVWHERTRLNLTSQYILEEDGRERVHTFLRTDPYTRRPKLQIHPRCRGLISEFGGGPSPLLGGGPYRYKTDSSGNVVSDRPIDANNHSCKALSYFLVNQFGHVSRRRRKSANYMEPAKVWRPF